MSLITNDGPGGCKDIMGEPIRPKCLHSPLGVSTTPQVPRYFEPSSFR